MMGKMWNLWHGCHKESEGCMRCYVYRRDTEFDKDSNIVHKTASTPSHKKEEYHQPRQQAFRKKSLPLQQ